MPSPPPSGSRRRLAAEERRALLREAARDTFLERGYAAAPVRTIAERAGVNEAMLYRHFASKEELFEEAIAGPLEAAVAATLETSLIPEPGSDEADVRARSVTFIRDLLAAMRDIAPMLGVLLAADPERGQRFYRERIEPALAATRDVVVTNLPNWTHRDFDPDVIVRMTYGVCWFLALDDRYGTHEPKPADDLAAEVLSVLFDGLIGGQTDGS